MIIGIGIDSVKVVRCKDWLHYAPTSLQRIFDLSEIAYCSLVPSKSAERFAVRFAAKEAFFKALCSANPYEVYNFFSVAPLIVIDKRHNGSPFFIRHTLNTLIKSHQSVLISLTHTSCIAQAFVIIQNTSCA